ncbi:MAG: LysM peptidoglycan-binding domain-containing protein [Firmicutes bacterium]|nr:LysM peptidoglycan-binding domain-containing protein [Bacillota bacterium]
MTWPMVPSGAPFHMGGQRPMMRLIPYVVQPGDTLFVIAQKFKTTTAAITGANCIQDPDLINVGQVLYIPCPVAAPPGGAM